MRRIRVEVLETTRVDALEVLLLACAPDDPAHVARVVMLGRFEIAVDGRRWEIGRLEAACLAVGAGAQTSDQYSPETSRLIWDWSGWVRTKMVVTASLGGLGLVFAVPLVTAASAIVLLLLARRAGHFVEPCVKVPSANLEASFRPLDTRLFARLRAARQRVTKPAVAALLGECAAAFAEVAWLLRSDGAALGNRALQRLDLRLKQLLERACGLAQAANDASGDALEPSSVDFGLDALSLLVTIRDRLVGLRPALSDSRSEEQSRFAVASALDAMADVDLAIERTLSGAA
jgi:hypothetical protein